MLDTPGIRLPLKLPASARIRVNFRVSAMPAANTQTSPRPLRAATDARGCPLTGANETSLQHYEAALALFQSWRLGAAVHIDQAIQETPAFVMPRVLQAYALVCSRDPRRVGQARPLVARLSALAANPFERQHLGTLLALLDDDYEGAKASLGRLLQGQPRDVLALQVAHALDYLTGDAVGMAERVAAVLPHWSPRLPGYAAVLAMHAFSLQECGDHARAEWAAFAALALNPLDARAHHAMAHVCEMTGRPGAGLVWLRAHADRWDHDTTVATHGNWHMALFHLARGELALALDLYDRRICPGPECEMADLIDASALLWRIELHGGEAGHRWSPMAAAWVPHIDDAFCSFNDIHAMLAFVGARDWNHAAQLERALAGSFATQTRHGATTRLFGASACRALRAYGQGDDRLAISLLAALPPSVRRIGGSQAQRDVLRLTLDQAAMRGRRAPQASGMYM
jgi:hypothetical protein